jgi:hypothetical protein
VEKRDMFAMQALPLAMKHWEEWHLSDDNDGGDSFEFNDHCLGLVAMYAYHLADMMVVASEKTRGDNEHYGIPKFI